MECSSVALLLLYRAPLLVLLHLRMLELHLFAEEEAGKILQSDTRMFVVCIHTRGAAWQIA